jgi:hypothetical protein
MGCTGRRAQAGEGAEIVDGVTGEVIERLPPQRS